MWERFKKALSPRRDPARIVAGGGDGFYVYRVRFQDGFKDVVSLVPHDNAFESGLAAEAIIGMRASFSDSSEPITAATFQPNKPFVQFLHDVIASHAPDLVGLREAARRQGNGWVYVIDARTPTPAGHVPPHDIIGAFEVKEGVVVPGSYRPNENHQLLSANGIFRLEPTLREHLMDRIMQSQRAFQNRNG